MIENESLADIESAWREHSAELVRFASLVSSPDAALDVVSEAFLRFDRHRGAVTNVRAYLFRTVHNVANDLHRSRRRRERRETLVATDRNAPHAAPPGDPDLIAAVSRLSPQQRAAVYFAYWEDLTESQIAETLGTSVGTIRRQLGRARLRLRKELS